MSQDRLLKRPPHNEKGKCRWCLSVVPKGRRSWCSEECVDQYLMRSSPDYVRRQLLKRDHGICAKCGLDCKVVELSLHRWHLLGAAVRYRYLLQSRTQEWKRHGRLGQVRYRQFTERVWKAYKREMEAIEQNFKLRGLPFNRHRKSLWDADHIVEVVEGGGLCDLSNYQTLCVACHKRKTAGLVKKLTKRRRIARTGQLEFDV